ncbi:MAG: phosphatase PAP2 family protein [Phycisphaerales bacterium]
MTPRSLLSLFLSASLLAACQTAPPNTTPPVAKAIDKAPAPQSQPAPASTAAPVVGKYIAPDAIDLHALLPDPPAPHSPISGGEIEIILAAQADASLDSRSRAVVEDGMTVWLFADVLGPNFNAKQMPKTAAFVKQIERDSHAISDRAKKMWERPRPYIQDPRIKLVTDGPSSNSYPSGHATRAASWTEVLCLLVPEKADAIRARGHLIGLDRLILGVHFPSDVAAGNALGKAIVDKMKENAAFQVDLAAARAEWSR